jgi:hypothetical protein
MAVHADIKRALAAVMAACSSVVQVGVDGAVGVGLGVDVGVDAAGVVLGRPASGEPLQAVSRRRVLSVMAAAASGRRAMG